MKINSFNLIFFLFFAALAAVAFSGAFAGQYLELSRLAGIRFQAVTPTPTYDPLATPMLPENPSQVDTGRHVYYYNCMPCHGDQGQGLTDEWRQVWEEDHRNCWDRGCHAGRKEDEGFPIPTVVPAIIEEQYDGHLALAHFANSADLFRYLKTTHPPQNPGILSDDEYNALVAFLWQANLRNTEEASGVQATLVATVSPSPGLASEMDALPLPASTEPLKEQAHEPGFDLWKIAWTGAVVLILAGAVILVIKVLRHRLKS